MNQQPPDVPPQGPRDNTGWAQPPAPEGPPGAFVDRQPVSSNQSLPPGAGAPLQPGPPMSVEGPNPAKAFNLTAAALVVLVGLVILIVVVGLLLFFGALGARHSGGGRATGLVSRSITTSL